MSDKFEQLKQKYIGSFKQKKNDMNAAWECKDFETLEGLLHKLAGSSGSYEFNALSVLCRKTMEHIDESFVVINKDKLEVNLKELFSMLDDHS